MMSLRSFPMAAIAAFGFALFFTAGIDPASAASSSVCKRLEIQLSRAQLKASGSSGGRYSDSIRKQQRALSQTERMAQRAGCGRSPNSRQCRPLQQTIAAMIANLRKLERMGGGRRGSNSAEIRQIKGLMQHHQCGKPQRSAAAKPRRNSGGLFSIFNRPQQSIPVVRVTPGYNDGIETGNSPNLRSYGSYRTVCVRTCDGYFFPISFSTSRAQFGEDAQKCDSMCSGAKTELFVFRMPNETLEDAKTLSGQSYSELPDAFRYQREFVPGCSCQVQDAANMLNTVREARKAAEQETEIAAAASDAETDATGKIEVAENTPAEPELREAKTGLRDVYLNPKIDEAAIAKRYVISFDTFPPLPISRPVPLDGQQLSLAQ